MIINIIIAAALVISYLIGSINSSILISKAKGSDIRSEGSGNAGATNMLRTYGKGMGVITLIIDALKGVVAVFAAKGVVAAVPNGGEVFAALPYMCAAAVVIGHDFPVFFGFKGGKGVATSLGAVLVLDWRIGLIVLLAALAVMAVTRYVSLGSIIGAAAYIIAEMLKMAFSGNFNKTAAVCVAVLGLMIIIRHVSNISRLIKGEENKLGAKKKESE